MVPCNLRFVCWGASGDKPKATKITDGREKIVSGRVCYEILGSFGPAVGLYWVVLGRLGFPC